MKRIFVVAWFVAAAMMFGSLCRAGASSDKVAPQVGMLHENPEVVQKMQAPQLRIIVVAQSKTIEKLLEANRGLAEENRLLRMEGGVMQSGVALDFLTENEAAIEGVKLLIGFVFLGVLLKVVVARSSKDELWTRVIRAIEASVQDTYDTYVRAKKKASKDGKLTESERGEARALAASKAASLLRSEGIDLAREVGSAYLPALIEKAVARFSKGK